MATYKAFSGDSVYDVAARLYKADTFIGIQDLLLNNPAIDLNATDLAGINLTYTPDIIRKIPIFTVPIVAVSKPSWTVIYSQSIYDLAVQLFGDVQKLITLVSAFPDLNAEISPGTKFTYLLSTHPVAQYFLNRGIAVATSLISLPTPISDFILREDGSYVLREDGFRIIRET